MTQSSLPYGIGMAWGVSPVNDPQNGLFLKATLKSEVGLGDEDQLGVGAETMVSANVLFMIEATAGMQFTPKSVMPSVVLRNDPDWRDSGRPGADWGLTKSSYGHTVDDVIEMMENATFGIGAMPVSWSGGNLRAERNLYGRDRDDSNNYKRLSDDPSEDIKLNADKGRYYYAPFLKADTQAEKDAIARVKAGYAKQSTKLQTKYTGYGAANHVGATHYNLTTKELGSSVSEYTYTGSNVSNAKKFPYALIFKDPQYWENGKPGAINTNDLVPNDSRLYQTKLVLWNLLEDEAMWSNMRIGLASTYLPTTNDTNFGSGGGNHTGLSNRYDFNGMYKVAPFGANVWTSTRFIGTNPRSGWPSASNFDQRRQYVNGVLTQAISGHVRGYNSIHAQYYPMWSHQTIEPLYSELGKAYSASERRTLQAVYKMLHRGSLLVPIREYGAGWNKGSLAMKQVDRIRQWINGFADLNSSNRINQFHYYRDPEIGVAGVFILPHAIYPDPRPGYAMTRQNYKDHTYTSGETGTSDEKATSVWYSHKTNNTTYRYDRFLGSSELENDEQETKNHFNGGSGEAAGSILDFFSPPTAIYNSLSTTSYPIRAECESNWVILITTGQELKTVNSSSYKYTTAQAIKNLYDATDKSRKHVARSNANDNPLIGTKIYAPYEQVSMWERNKSGDVIGTPKKVDLDDPIRTLVIGIVPEVDDKSLSAAEKGEVEEMHINLAKMAVAGQGGNPDNVVTLQDVKNKEEDGLYAFTASNPDELTDAIKMAFTLINNSAVVQPGSGTLPQSDALDDLGDETSDIYSYEYRIMNSNQWEAKLRRDVVSKDAAGDVVLHEKWEIGTIGEDEREEQRHKIVPASGKRNVKFWDSGSLKKLEGNEALFGSLTRIESGDIIPPAGRNFTDVKPYNAFAKWLWGEDYSYRRSAAYARHHMLTDLGQGGAVMVNDTRVASGDSPLPGYYDWARSSANSGGNPVFYVQTNDGLLRLINPVDTPDGNGKEIMAILPPPSMIPGRLATMKTNATGGGLQWLDVTGSENSGGYRSYPAFTLDGALQTHNFYLKLTGDSPYKWGKYLLGALGRGGKGLYMLDVSVHDTPKLMWYREAVSGDKLVRSNGGHSYVYTSGDLGSASSADVKAEKAYLNLGFNSPRTAMGVARMKDTNSEYDNKQGMRNFIALAGGAMSDVPLDLTKNGGEGATLLMIDPQDGSILKAFDGSSFVDGSWKIGSFKEGPSPIMGMMVSEPTVFRSKENPYMAGGLIAADNRGNIFRVDLEDRASSQPLDPVNWRINTIATLQTITDSAGSYAIPHGLVVGMQSGTDNMWIAGGNADISVKKKPLSADSEGILRNEKQMIFSFVTNPSQTGPYARGDNFQSLDPDVPDDIFSLGNGKFGWYFELEEPDQNAQDDFREYVATKPVFINGTLFVATFLQKNKINVEAPSLCVTNIERQFDGESRLYAVDIRTGKPTLWKADDGTTPAKYLTFEHIRIVSLTDLAKGGKGKLMVRFEILGSGHNLERLMASNPILKRIRNGTGGYTDSLTIDEPLGGNGKRNLPPETTFINYWLAK
ncbi:MAG: pilus assembly protein [Synergistaceae bacterium]|nr:pilus assembly protein [Synergistaceae bacterium]